jgi:hypothetical protein
MSSKIPKVIYMCHKKLDKIKLYSLNWKRLNPDYEIKLYDDTMCQDFLLNEYSQLYVDIFNFLQEGCIKADFWRVCVIYKYGGLYVDADIEPFYPIHHYVDPEDDFMSCISGNFIKSRLEYQLNPHIILAKKNDTLLKECIDKYVDMYMTNIPYSYGEYSICKLMILDGIPDYRTETLVKDNKRYKFITERMNFGQCEYKNKVVLHNRYREYQDHNFVDVPHMSYHA